MKKGYKALIVVLILIIVFLIGTFTSPVVREIITNKSADKTVQLFYSDVLINGILVNQVLMRVRLVCLFLDMKVEMRIIQIRMRLSFPIVN